MLERFTSTARSAVVDAQEQARRLGSDEVRAEHLLLAIAAQESAASRVLRELGLRPDAVAREVVTGGETDVAALRSIGVDLGSVRRQAEEAFGPGALSRPPARRGLRFRLLRRAAPGHLRFSAPARRALEQSLREALALEHRTIGVEHLLLGLLADERGPAAFALSRVGVSPQQVRDRLVGELRRAA